MFAVRTLMCSHRTWTRTRYCWHFQWVLTNRLRVCTLVFGAVLISLLTKPIQAQTGEPLPRQAVQQGQSSQEDVTSGRLIDFEDASDNSSDYAEGWYYLFSTVPQTLAAAYAVMFGIALLRFQSLHNSIEGLAAHIGALFTRIGVAGRYRVDVGKHAVLHQWGDYLLRVRMLVEDPGIANKFGGEHDPDRSKSTANDLLTEFEQRLADASALRRQLWKALTVTGIAIVLTTVTIPLGRFVTTQGHFILGWLFAFVLMILTGCFYVPIVSTLISRLGSIAGKDTPKPIQSQ